MDPDDRREFERQVPFAITETAFDVSPLTPFFDAIGNHESTLIERMLEEHPEYVNASGEVATAGPLGYVTLEERSPLNYAVYKGNSAIVDILLDHRADIERRGEFGETPIHDAAMYGYDPLVQILADRGADLNAQTLEGATPVIIAAQNGNSSTFKLLLDLGANARIAQHDGSTAMHVARTVETARALVHAGLNVDTPDAEGYTPLSIAVFNGHVDVALYLIECGADPHKVDHEGKSPIDFAAEMLSPGDLEKVKRAIAKC